MTGRLRLPGWIRSAGHSRTAVAAPVRRTPDLARAQPASRTILHIGTMKSGTSYLQEVLDHNRTALASAGVRYLGRGTRAVWDVLELRGDTAENDGAWSKLITSATTAQEPVRLLSMEVLSTADDAQAREVVSSFGTGPIEVILTARDLVRVIPSAWQNAIKHGGRPSFEEFVDAVMESPPEQPNGVRFWRQHDVAGIAARWAACVGTANVHLVTLPPPGASPDVLWQRFCSVLGVDAGQFPTGPARPGNTSLSYSDAELLRRVNRRIGGDLGRLGYNRYVRSFLAHDIMRGTPDDSAGEAPDVPVLDDAAHSWAVRRSEELTAALRDSGVEIIGDLDELLVTPRTESVVPPGPRIVYPTPAVRAMATLLRKLAELDPETSSGRPAAAADEARRGAARKRKLARQPGPGSAPARRGDA